MMQNAPQPQRGQTFYHQESFPASQTCQPARAETGSIWPALLWEGRRTLSWLWLLPPIVIVGIFVITWYTYNAALQTQSLMKASSEKHLAAVVTLDYASGLRSDLELLMPLLCVFLVAGIIAHEWRSGTLAHLVMRNRLNWFFAVRLTYVLLYLLCLLVAAILISWWMTPQPPAPGDLWTWLWQSVVVILAPSSVLGALGLLCTHLFTSLTAGYIVPCSLWLGNWLFANAVMQSHDKNDLLLYLLFGWGDSRLTNFPDGWLTGKWLLLLLAIILFACQIPILSREQRFIRSISE